MSKYIEGVQHSPSEIGCIESPNSSKPRFQETGSWISLRSLEVENGIVSQQGLSFLSMQTVCFRIWTKTVETLVRLSFFCVCSRQNFKGLGHHEGKCANHDRIFIFEFLSNEVTQKQVRNLMQEIQCSVLINGEIESSSCIPLKKWIAYFFFPPKDMLSVFFFCA